MSIAPQSRDSGDKLTKALQRFMKEDPTFRVSTDEETSETLIAGMGELHLDIYVERIRREYKVDVIVGAPKVSYREAPTQNVEFDHKRKKQTGGSGQYGHIKGILEVLPEDAVENFEFVDDVVQGRIPREYIPSVEKGFRSCMNKGPLAGFPLVGLRVILNDGSYHDVDSSDMAFQLTAQECFREYFMKMKPVLLEPIMKFEVEVPTAFQGTVVGNLTSRRGMVIGNELNGASAIIEAEVPLSETFGYSTDLRSMTQGQGTFSMEFAKYRRVPASIQEEVIAAKKKELVGAK
jgi:elongation factor G